MKAFDPVSIWLNLLRASRKIEVLVVSLFLQP